MKRKNYNDLKHLQKLDAMTEINGKWVPARPYQYRTLKEKIIESWRVFIGKTDSVKWPENQ